MVLDFEVLHMRSACCRRWQRQYSTGVGAKQRLEAPGKRQRPSKMEAMPLPHLTCFPHDPFRVIVFFVTSYRMAKNLGNSQRWWENIFHIIYIYIYCIYPHDIPIDWQGQQQWPDISWSQLMEVGRSWRLKYGATCFLTKEVRELLSQGTVINKLYVFWLTYMHTFEFTTCMHI